MQHQAFNATPKSARCSIWLIAISGLIAVVLPGCGDQGPPGVDVWGSVTWQGKPVPRGFIIFNPDVSQGNSGHQGMAEINDGRYDTRAAGGRRVAAGSQVVSISGFASPTTTSDRPRGPRLFLPHEQPVNPPATSGEFDLVVPDSVLGIKAAPIEDE